MPLHRSGLQAHHIQAMDRKNGQDLMQGAALMGHTEAGTDLITALTQFHLGRHHNKAGGILRIAVDVLCQNVQAINVRTSAAANRSLGLVAAPGHHHGAARRVILGHLLPVRMFMEKALALEQALLVGIDGLNVR